MRRAEAKVSNLSNDEESIHPILLAFLDQAATSKGATPHTTVKDFIVRK